MPKKVHNKLKIMEDILALGTSGHELTIYNITKLLNKNTKNLKHNFENDNIHYVKEQTISNILNELIRLKCIKIKTVKKTKMGKEKKIYKLSNNYNKIFEVYRKYYIVIYKILKVVKSETISNEDLDIIFNLVKLLLDRKGTDK